MLLTVTAVALLVASGSSLGHFQDGESGEHGTIMVDVDRSTDPCMGTVHLSGMDIQNGTIEMSIFVEGTAPDQPLDQRTFNGTLEEDGEGYMATLTDFEMSEGWEHYFTVDFEGAGHGMGTDLIAIEADGCGDPADEPCFGITLMGTANSDGTITVTAEGLDEAARLTRHSVGTMPDDVATLTPEQPSFTDHDVEDGVTYTYDVIVDHEVCDSIQVTAIPVFPSGVAMVLASVLGIGAYAMVRRRA